MCVCVCVCLGPHILFFESVLAFCLSLPDSDESILDQMSYVKQRVLGRRKKDGGEVLYCKADIV